MTLHTERQDTVLVSHTYRQLHMVDGYVSASIDVIPLYKCSVQQVFHLAVYLYSDQTPSSSLTAGPAASISPQSLPQDSVLSTGFSH